MLTCLDGHQQQGEEDQIRDVGCGHSFPLRQLLSRHFCWFKYFDQYVTVTMKYDTVVQEVKRGRCATDAMPVYCTYYIRGKTEVQQRFGDIIIACAGVLLTFA